MKLRPFQKRFIRGALAPGIDTAALSLARGNGKSWLAAHILTRCLTPGDVLHVAGAEYLLCAASLEQARLSYLFSRSDLEPTGEYRFLDSVTRIGITHKATVVLPLAHMKLELRIPDAETSHDALLTSQIISAVSFVSRSTGATGDDLLPLRAAAVALTRDQYDGYRGIGPKSTANAWMAPYRSYKKPE